MPSTHLSLYYHLVFSTKGRLSWIKESWGDPLYAYLCGIIRNLGGSLIICGGEADHIHILLRLKATHCIADVLREIKSSSSMWVHKTIRAPFFVWQDGYAAFTVSSSNVEAVKKYIEQQKEHHKKRSFQEEYLELLRKSGIEFDEKYLW